MITHVVLIQPKVSTTNEQLSAFLERVQCTSRGDPRHPYLSLWEKTAASTMEGLLMGLLCVLLTKPTYRHIILIQLM